MTSGLFVLAVVVISAILVCGGADAQTTTLNIRARYPAVEMGSNFLALRGDKLGLNWSAGMKMSACPGGVANCWNVTLRVSSQDVGSVLSIKALFSDKNWMVGANTLITIPAKSATVDFYPWFWSTSGKYELLPVDIFSKKLNNERSVIIYTPPSYVENFLKPMSNVLIMHDGQNLFNDSTSFAGRSWRCQDTLDPLIVQGDMDEVFIIGVYNTAERIDEYTYSVDPTVGQGGKGDIYLDFLISDVLPTVKAYYPRIVTAKPNLGILGSSLGGLISCYAGWTRPSEYGKAGCMSSSFWWNSEDFNNTIMIKYKAPGGLDFYLDSGNAGPDNDDETQTITVRNHMELLGFRIDANLHYYLDNGGQHSEYYWGTRFHEPMTALYPPTTLTAN